MSRLLFLAVVSIAGCIGPPDHVSLSYQRDLETGSQRANVGFTCPVTYGGRRVNSWSDLFDTKR